MSNKPTRTSIIISNIKIFFYQIRHYLYEKTYQHHYCYFKIHNSLPQAPTAKTQTTHCLTHGQSEHLQEDNKMNYNMLNNEKKSMSKQMKIRNKRNWVAA